MKNINSIFLLPLMLFTYSCSSILDINENPNEPTESTPELVFPQALVSTAARVPAYSNYGGRTVGYIANGGGVSGWGSFISYNYTTSDFDELFQDTYNTLEDLQYVINTTIDDPSRQDYRYACEIFKVYNFINLVDTYNNVPYSEALQGLENLTPAYDNAEDIYKDLGDELDEAILYFLDNEMSGSFQISDFLFHGDPTKWAKLANTLKLKLIIKAKDKVDFTTTSMNSVGFITEDVIVNPGYTRADGKQNPTWNRWAYDYAGNVAAGANQVVPTPYIMAFFNGSKLSDNARAVLFFKSGTSTGTNQLGYQQDDAAQGLSPSCWFVGSNVTTYSQVGVLKGPAAGQPIFLLSESFFLQAEAVLDGIISADIKTLFDSGIKESYVYLNRNESDATSTSANKETFFTSYKTANSSNYLVNFDLATTNAQKLEAIITQKYIAFNMLFGHESWNEYRRTGYPISSAAVTEANRNLTFVSLVSESTATDRLPTRILYPASEFAYNPLNVPSVDKYSSKIFWAR
ncbi:SusD/RagB family nutrient-binding outer membrane lipoprotein [Sphingobacterium hungaricum]|uniref:SusD/RagB family nutrient-binding outer membrane lipoprotein n=1 Tax=Sphingobacterium hungaricum TaxID=2082723 RepID=A0A928UXF2_9SPHI|nr:SusD/RagB family nutrient-binding outer membrane lipoprotein [Sphingobacterium hungaricum]MBE8713120.1 SusD/RagB family nutrient-binding outer membrane lipoprotein [Sphingobacterium hungaricum]